MVLDEISRRLGDGRPIAEHEVSAARRDFLEHLVPRRRPLRLLPLIDVDPDDVMAGPDLIVWIVLMTLMIDREFVPVWPMSFVPSSTIQVCGSAPCARMSLTAATPE